MAVQLIVDHVRGGGEAEGGGGRDGRGAEQYKGIILEFNHI